MNEENVSFFKGIKNFVIGRARSVHDPQLFHKLSLVAFFAWIGLGSDGLSSSCYGPEESFLALQGHAHLGIFVALATAATIFIISASYSQIIELFPSGGGGYMVASRLISPSVGLVSGCALIVDYVLTITLSVASGADAFFSFLPHDLYFLRLPCAIGVLFLLIILNVRGVKESVLLVAPIFVTFLITHAAVIIYVVFANVSNFDDFAIKTTQELGNSTAELGVAGVFILMMRAYSMGAGTYTGIEAVSCGVPILREPKVVTAKKTMKYMSISLAVVVLGLMLGYLFFGLEHVPGKTLNAVLFERIVADWGGGFGKWFVAVTLFSEALLLFAAAQSGFFGGPRVLANMARDRWFPSQFAILSERFVTHNGIILMGSAALLVMVLSKGSVKFLVILYSINVFIDFFLSQLGMVFYWWGQRKTNDRWKRKIAVVATGFTLTSFILFSVVILKFKDGGWMTILITGFLIVIAILIKRHYMTTAKQLRRLSSLIDTIDITQLNEVKNNPDKKDLAAVKYNAKYKTAVIFVNGYNGLGLHTLFNVIRLFEDTFRNFFFIQVGILNAGNFKGPEELDRLELTVKSDLDRYVQFMRSQGFYAEGFSGIGTDPVEHMCNIAYKIYDRHPNSVFFGGQMVFEKETFLTRMLYNYTTFTIQRKLYQHGIPFLIMPIRVE